MDRVIVGEVARWMEKEKDRQIDRQKERIGIQMNRETDERTYAHVTGWMQRQVEIWMCR